MRGFCDHFCSDLTRRPDDDIPLSAAIRKHNTMVHNGTDTLYRERQRDNRIHDDPGKYL